MVVVVLSDEELYKLIARRGRRLLKMANYVSKQQAPGEILIRPLLGELHSQAMQIEELLDAYGARNNRKWCLFRLLTATIKLFSDVSYQLLHIEHALPAYRLLPIEQDFAKATEQAMAFTGDVLLRAINQLLFQAHLLGLPIPTDKLREEICSENLPPGRLLQDRAVSSKAEMAPKTVTMLATAFLNLAAESNWVHCSGRSVPEEYASYIPDTISEENLRSLELRFHNLQSLYDTYVSETETEGIDANLPIMRGHISVVYHLLNTATSFAHFYERHVNVNKQTDDIPAFREQLVNPDALLAMLMNYSLLYVSQYLTCAQRLCQAMLKRYAENGEIEVPVPQYRGFHVRPATLVSMLVLHYGSDVRMELDGEQYDASSPLELFRANEKMNARKRRQLAAEIVRLGLVPEKTSGSIGEIIRGIVLALAEQGKLILYEQPLHLPEGFAQKREGAPLEQVIDAMAQLLAIGKIDVEADMKVKFIGDKRVLADIEMLAKSGYGEDKFGNNIPLPETLGFLRR